MITDERLSVSSLSSRLDENLDTHIWETVVERMTKIELSHSGLSDRLAVIERKKPIDLESELLLVSELDRKLKLFEFENQ